MIRRYGCIDSDQQYQLRPGAYAVLLRGNALLLTHQQDPAPEIQLPGGGIDPGESAIRALHREVFEETGWSISKPRRVGAYRRFTFMPEYDTWAEKLCHVFLARPVKSHGPPSEAGHLAIWVPPSDALDLLVDPGSRDFVLKLFS